MRRRITSISLMALMILGMALTGCGDANGTQESDTFQQDSPGLPNDRGI